MNRTKQIGKNHGTDATKGCRRIFMVTNKWDSNMKEKVVIMPIW